MTDIFVPSLGESISEATVAGWQKAVGDRVAADEILVELETDKVTQEIRAPEAGVLTEVLAQEGDTVAVGAVLARLSVAAGATTADGGTGGSAAERSFTDQAPVAKPEPIQQEAPPAASQSVDLVVPQMGESVSEATVAEWLKQAGDVVAQDEALVVLETDKASQEIAAPQAGVLSEIVAQAGADVGVGAILGRIAVGEGAAAAVPATPSPAAAPPQQTGATTAPAAEVKHGPAAEKALRENPQVDASSIQGSGKDGRITKGDVQKAASQPAPAAAKSSAPSQPIKPTSSGPRAKADREERVKMSRLRQSIASRLKEAQNTAAMLTTFNEVDMKQLMDLRKDYKDLFEKKFGTKLGFMGLFVKAAVQALKDFPAVNAEIDGTDIVYKNYYDIGVAVSTPQGLVVPVIRDCDTRTIAEIEDGIAEAAKKARDGKLALSDLTGGTFSITNGGIFGSLLSTPILNTPQSAILGMHAIKERPVVINGQIEARPMMYLALSYDHRIIDGREAVSFLVRIKEAIEDPRRLVMAL